MKKVITFIIILAISVGIGFSWTKMEDYVTKKLHPMKYYEYVEKYSEEYAVPREVVFAVIKSESSFVSDAISSKGAVGLMQVMPSTFEWLCTKTGDAPDVNMLYAPEVNIKYGTYLLSYLYSRFGVWETAFAAYNAGEGRVKGWLSDERYGKDGRLIDIPFEETETYVKRVTENVKVYSELLAREDKEKREKVPVIK